MSMLVNEEGSLWPDDVLTYNRSSLEAYWDDFEGYFEYNSEPYYNVSKICTETLTRIWQNDFTAAKCLTEVYQNQIRQADIGDDGDDGDEHKNDIQDEILEMERNFENNQDEQHPFLNFN